MGPDPAAWLANVRTEAAAPGTLLIVVRDRSRAVAIFPDQVVGKSDEELLAFIAARLEE
ncbi:hypothetical protein [Massilia rhizosphaerae]|uniref:hypothetical protein n=1 Tax=Massilia rhizosphaerae TaxID=2784389 RepID=UPI0018DBA353|nr:hypothetical protein [Massilia rhizosphaerae]